MNIVNLGLLITGLIITLYAVYAAKKARSNEKYFAICDLSDRISCKKFFLSKYAHIFNIPITPIASAFYALLIIAEIMNYNALVMWGAGIMLVVAGTFTIIAEKYLNTACLICYSMLIVNALIVFNSYFHWW